MLKIKLYKIWSIVFPYLKVNIKMWALNHPSMTLEKKFVEQFSKTTSSNDAIDFMCL